MPLVAYFTDFCGDFGTIKMDLTHYFQTVMACPAVSERCLLLPGSRRDVRMRGEAMKSRSVAVAIAVTSLLASGCSWDPQAAKIRLVATGDKYVSQNNYADTIG